MAHVRELTLRQSVSAWIIAAFYDPDQGLLKKFYDWWYGKLPHRMYQYVTEHAERGNPDSVIEALDRYNREEQWSFCLGDEKATIVRKIVNETKPRTCLELGAFIGYSAINAARDLETGSRYICVERNETRSIVARKLIEYAGLQDVVQVVNDFSYQVIPKLKDDFNIDELDYVFIDHLKGFYKPDLLLLEESKLLKKGTVIVADNVVFPGAPAYVEYVRSSPKYRSEHFESVLEYTTIPDGLEKSTFIA